MTDPKASAEGDRSPLSLQTFVDLWLGRAKTERADNWCNTQDAPIWKSIHRERAAVFETCAAQLSAYIAKLEAEARAADAGPVSPQQNLEVGIPLVQEVQHFYESRSPACLASWDDVECLLDRSDALRAYVRHKPECELAASGLFKDGAPRQLSHISEDGPWYPAKCTCGLSSLVERTPSWKNDKALKEAADLRGSITRLIAQWREGAKEHRTAAKNYDVIKQPELAEGHRGTDYGLRYCADALGAALTPQGDSKK